MYNKSMYALDEEEKKAGYNQSANITELIGNLLGSYILYINSGDLEKALNSVSRIVDIISAKVKEDEIDKIDELTEDISADLKSAILTHNFNGRTYFTNPKARELAQRKIVKLFRLVNKLQDKYGYGMIDQDDPRLAAYE